MEPSELKSIMSELRLTQREVAERLCVNIRTVRRWVSGEAIMKGSSKFALTLWRQAEKSGLNWR